MSPIVPEAVRLERFGCGNVNRTAERLGTTQSTVSMRVRALETAVGAKLFQRGRAGAMPTASGTRFEQHARALKAAWNYARSDVGTLDRFGGMLRISAQFSLMHTLLLDWADVLYTACDRVALHIEADYSAQIVSDLAAGTVDMGFCLTRRCVRLYVKRTVERIGGAPHIRSYV